jgi:hypothetical protein
MTRLALVLAIALAAPTLRADPPAWMPAPPRPPTAGDEQRVRHLKHEAAAFGAIGIALFAGGIAVNVVALDVPQGERATRQVDGSVVTERFRDDANWAELAGGLALMATGFALVSLAVLKAKEARKLQALE